MSAYQGVLEMERIVHENVNDTQIDDYFPDEQLLSIEIFVYLVSTIQRAFAV